MKARHAYLLLLGLSAAALTAAYLDRRATQAGLAAVPVPAALPVLGSVPDFSLSDSQGNAVRRSDVRGPFVADFIFTRCAGQCPMVTERLHDLKLNLPGLRVVSFSVDPADTPGALRHFAKAQHADWPFLWGKDVMTLVKDGFKLPVAQGGPPEEPITHARTVVLVDAEDRIRGYYDPEDMVAVAGLARDYQSLNAAAAVR